MPCFIQVRIELGPWTGHLPHHRAGEPAGIISRCILFWGHPKLQRCRAQPRACARCASSRFLLDRPRHQGGGKGRCAQTICHFRYLAAVRSFRHTGYLRSGKRSGMRERGYCTARVRIAPPRFSVPAFANILMKMGTNVLTFSIDSKNSKFDGHNVGIDCVVLKKEKG